ncbi:DUF222 domain-containing protein [Gordonia phosphorivorans]|uniref:DUF222 domain-containing protein n=1 Tax=Gordonia phosphorivorans TaxID=1056982 RepID=A0ABV6H853_9ACTN
MVQRIASRWPDADLTGCGLPAPGTDLANLPTGAVVAAITATKNGPCFLEWQLFQFALSMHARVCASTTDVVATQKSLIDAEAQTTLELQMSLESTEYAARVLLLDAFDARDRLPRVYATMRLGLIDRDRFHRIAHETRIVFDEAVMAKIDAVIAAEILGAQRGYTSISVTKIGALARRHVAENDPDAVRREREGAKDARSLGHQTLEAGMAQLFLTATAEDVRLARQMLDAVIAGRCPEDPRTKTQARSDAAIALLQRKPFTCECGSEGCTAAISDVELDARAARIVVHVLCDATTLEGGDKCGYLDGHGPISAEHVREIAARGDAVIHQHRLDDLLEPNPASAAGAQERPDEAALHRRAPRSETPDERRGDGSRPEAGNDGQPAAVIAKTALPSDPYRPNLLTDLIARFLWGTCSIPGCERAAFACDLDHVAEFDNVRPDLGWPTCAARTNSPAGMRSGPPAAPSKTVRSAPAPARRPSKPGVAPNARPTMTVASPSNLDRPRNPSPRPTTRSSKTATSTSRRSERGPPAQVGGFESVVFAAGPDRCRRRRRVRGWARIGDRVGRDRAR